MPVLVIVAGPNGSGKTTLVRSGAVADVLPVPARSINADDIAFHLTGGASAPTDDQSLAAAQAADTALDQAIAAGVSIVVETVLSSDKYKHRIRTARAAGYSIVLIYVSVLLAALNVARVANRHAVGGHGVPEGRIRARRARSHERFGWFAEQADRVLVYDNSRLSPTVCATKDDGGWWLGNLALLPPDLRAILLRQAGA